MKLPKGQFAAIMGDPPSPFATWSRKGEGRTPQHRYKCEAFDKLAAVPVASVAKPDCFLFLWVPSRSVFMVKPLMAAWGFGLQWISLHRGQAERERCRLAHGHRLHHEKEHGGMLAGAARQTTTEVGRRTRADRGASA